jgi:hypothetical protein
MHKKTYLSALLLVFCWILCSTTAFAQTYTWTGNAGDDDWQTPSNWDLNSGFPGAGHTAQFTSGSGTIGPLTNIPNVAIGQVILNGFTGTVQIGENLTCGTLTITTGTLQINSGVDLAVNNSTTINNVGTLTLNDPDVKHSLGVFALSNGGTFNGPSSGDVKLKSATISGLGSIFNGNGGTYQTTSGGITVSGGTFYGNNGDYTIYQNQQLAILGGTFNAGSGNYDLSINKSDDGDFNITVFNRTGGTFNRDTSSFTVTVNADGTGTKTATLTASAATGFHNLKITSNNAGSERVVAFSGTTFTIHNELERTGRLTDVTGSNLQYASGATLRYNPNNNQNVFGEWPASSGPTNVIKQGSNMITLTSSAGSRTIPLGGVLQIDGGTFRIGSSVTLTVNGALRRNGGSLTNNGTLTYGTTGTQNVDGKSYTGAVLWYSAGVSIGAEFPASSSVPNLLITTSGTVSGSGNRTVQGIFRMTDGTLNLGSNTLTVLGNISGSEVAGGTTAAIAINTTLNLGGGSSSTLAQTISGSLTLNKLTIDKQATGGPWAPENTVTVSGTITFTANGTLNIQNGTLAFTSPTLTGSLSNLSLNITANAILKTGGAAVHNIGGTFIVNGKIVFNGTGAEILPPNRTIARIEINNSNNVQVSNLNGTVTVTDSLIFTLGNITQTDATNKVFVLASTCKVSGSGYVDGPVQRVFPTTTGDGIVPTGRSTMPNPSANWITLNFSSGSNSATLSFEQINGNIGGPASGTGWSARSTTRYWKIEVVSGSISSPSYGITVQKANSGISSPLGRILRYTSLTPVTPESTYVAGQTDNGTTVATPDTAYTNFQLAFTIVRKATSELIWRGGQSPNPNSWHQASNWWEPSGSVSSNAPDSTTNVIIDGARPSALNTVDSNATVLIDSTANCQSLTVSDTSTTTSTLEIAATLNVGSVPGYNPANTTFGQNSKIVWKDGSGGVQADAYQNLTVVNNSALGTQGTGSITVSGNMVKQGSGTFTPASGNAITVSGNYTNDAGDANYSNASLTLNTGGTTFTLTSGTVSGNVTLSSQTIQLNGGTMSANLTLNGSGPQTINGTGTTSLAGLTVTNGNQVNLGGQTRTVTGNVVLNNSTGTITSGTLRMAGTSAQTISGSGSGTVANLEVNNSSGVTLNRPITLTGTLTMTTGNLTTTNTNILTTPATSGGSASSFVNGPLAISGSSYPRTYPIGKSTAYRPISIGGSGTATIRAEMINTPPNGAGLSGLARISQVRYFNVDLISGSVSSPTITINYEADDGVAGPPNGPSNLRVARSTDNNNWVSIGGTGSGSPSGSITSSATTFEASPNPTYFALGSFTNDNPLPVQLSSFTLTPRQRSIELVWQTESESENKGFIILRSESETGGYQEIASYLNTPALLGQGTTSSATRYRYVDSHNLQPGRAYWYKLVDVDYSGRRHEHQPMSVQTAFEYALDQNYPNPFNPSTAIQFSLEKSGKTVLEIYNTLGQKVATLVNGELSAGAHRYQWNASGLASGVYFYRLQSNEFVATKKMILVK